MPRRERHFLWEIYIALAAEGGRTEAQGREFIKATFPSLAHMVDPVVAAQGRTDKLESALLSEWSDTAQTEESTLAGNDMNNLMRAKLGDAGNYEGRRGTSTANDDGEEGATEEDAFTANIRQQATRGRVNVGDDGNVNNAIRQAIGRPTAEVS